MEDPGKPVFVYESSNELRMPDQSPASGQLSVVNNPDGGTTFNAASITAWADTVRSGGGDSDFEYGTTVLGNSSAAYAATIATDNQNTGTDLKIHLLDINPSGDTLSSASELASTAISLNTGNHDGYDRVELSADVNHSAGTADLTANLYADGDLSSPAYTVTANGRDLAPDGASADGQAGLVRVSTDNSGRVEFGAAGVEWTPVPEPSSVALLALGSLAVLGRRRCA